MFSTPRLPPPQLEGLQSCWRPGTPAAARLCFVAGQCARQLYSVGQVAEGRVSPLGIGSHSGYPLEFPHSLGFALGGHLGAGEVLRAITVPCCSQAQECRLSRGALIRTTMERAGLRRTCPQRPHGGYGTLSLRSELKARSCQQLQGRKASQAQLAVPNTHPGKDQRGTLWGHERDHLFLSTCPASHMD